MLQNPYYEQLQTALPEEKRGYIYQHSASAARIWVIGPTLGGEDFELQERAYLDAGKLARGEYPVITAWCTFMWAPSGRFSAWSGESLQPPSSG